jgi:MinD superfamily P-loop ATPase
MQIAVASGKGGTGKTTVSVNLFHFLTKYTHSEVKLVDCDVEEPNTALFFNDAALVATKQVYRQIPVIDTEACTFCKKCSEWCAFNAITLLPSKKFTLIHSDLCHSCGACTVACPPNAITETADLLGSLSTYLATTGQTVTEGRLKVGSPMQTMLIKLLKKDALPNSTMVILDAPPGTGCPVVQTISGTDFVVLVTEPTPFGLHDLKLITEVVQQMEIPFGVIINKSGLGAKEIYRFLKDENITLLGEIPFSKAYARIYSEGKLISDIPKETERIYKGIIRKIMASV